MKKDCLNILLYLDNELDKEKTRAFSEHLKTCQQCRDFIRSHGDQYVTLAEETIPALSTGEMVEIWGNIQSELKTPPSFNVRWLAAAAIILVILNIFNYFTLTTGQFNSGSQIELAMQSDESVYELSALDNTIYELTEEGGAIDE